LQGIGEDKMKQDLLTQYIEAGFPQLKAAARLPQWLLPSLPEVVREIGDRGLMEMAEPVGLSQRIKSVLTQAPEADQIPAQQWQAGISDWKAIHQVRPVTLSLLRATEKVEAFQRRGQVQTDPIWVARALATIAYATFAPYGNVILDRLAAILGGKATEPAELLTLYLKTMGEGDQVTLARIEKEILENPDWAEWSRRFLKKGQDLPLTPKVVGIHPAATDELITLLAAMVKEMLNADDKRNHPGGESQNCSKTAE
jgi:hypothetical protein